MLLGKYVYTKHTRTSLTIYIGFGTEQKLTEVRFTDYISHFWPALYRMGSFSLLLRAHLAYDRMVFYRT